MPTISEATLASMPRGDMVRQLADRSALPAGYADMETAALRGVLRAALLAPSPPRRRSKRQPKMTKQAALALSTSAVDKLTVANARLACKHRGLLESGAKAVVLARLSADVANTPPTAGPVEDPPTAPALQGPAVAPGAALQQVAPPAPIGGLAQPPPAAANAALAAAAAVAATAPTPPHTAEGKTEQDRSVEGVTRGPSATLRRAAHTGDLDAATARALAEYQASVVFAGESHLVTPHRAAAAIASDGTDPLEAVFQSVYGGTEWYSAKEGTFAGAMKFLRRGPSAVDYNTQPGFRS